MLMHSGYQSRRERVLDFIVGVALCCVISGCLSILAKDGRDQSISSTPTARLATPHNDASMILSESSDDPGHMDRVSKEKGRIHNGLQTAAALCIAAAMCCGITTIGAILLLRGPRESYGYLSEEENSEEHMDLMDRSCLTEVNTPEYKSKRQTIVRDELKDVTPEEAV